MNSEEQKNPWVITNEKEIYTNKWIELTEYDVINPLGGTGIYGKVHFKNTAIGILPLDDEMNTWLVGQYRFTLNAYSWEIPEGGGPVEEDPLPAAQRELLEETGLKATRWMKLLTMHLSNSVSDELGIVFIAKGLSQHKPQPEETEQLTVRKLPFEEVYKMVMNGTITDSLTVAAILKVKLLMLNNQL
jgi:8-oxo-dGTP pyrophosphatase MutT (NUDIX family)